MKKSGFQRFVFLSLFLLLTGISYSQGSFQKPKLEHKDSWSVIMIPDPQNYSKWNRNQPILDLMMAWIEDQIDSLNIKMVVCTGDLVEQNNIINRGHNGDQSSQRQWEFISRSFSRLDGKVPYIAATGNHDYSVNREGVRSSRFSEFFKVDNNFLNRKTIAQNTTDEQGQPTLENSAYELRSLNGKDYLFMTVEFGPRDTVLVWAKNIAKLEQYKNHRIVLLTHGYLDSKDNRTNGEVTLIDYAPYAVKGVLEKTPKVKLPFGNNGQQIWEKLVQPAHNIEMVLCGHIFGEGYRKDKNNADKTVHQILFDAQSEGGGHRNGNGGNGWLRILEFFPDNKTVNVRTFSPLFGSSPETRKLAWKRDARNEFTLHFD